MTDTRVRAKASATDRGLTDPGSGSAQTTTLRRQGSCEPPNAKLKLLALVRSSKLKDGFALAHGLGEQLFLDFRLARGLGACLALGLAWSLGSLRPR